MNFLVGVNVSTIIVLAILSVYLLIRQSAGFANKILAFVVFFPSFAIVINLLAFFGLQMQYEYIFISCYFLNFLWAPVYYQYINTLLQKPVVWNVRRVLVCVPALIAGVLLFWFCIQSAEYRDAQYAGISKNIYPVVFVVLDILLLIQVIVVQTFAYRMSQRRILEIKCVFSDARFLAAQWVKEFIVVYALFGYISFLPVCFNLPLSYFIVFLPVSILGIYFYLVRLHIRRPSFFTPAQLDLLNQIQTEFKTHKELQTQTSIQLTDLSLVDKIQDTVQANYLYLNRTLTVLQVADACGLSVHLVSECIKTKYGVCFFDYINNQRVEAAKSKLLEFGFDESLIDNIGTQFGFNTQKEFIKAFKKSTGYLPLEFCKISKQYF